jgi:hypothetical protein
VEHKEALQTSAVVGQASNLVRHGVNLLLSDGVVTASIYSTAVVVNTRASDLHKTIILTVASSILLAGHQSLGMEETPVRASPDLINDIGLEVNVE